MKPLAAIKQRRILIASEAGMSRYCPLYRRKLSANTQKVFIAVFGVAVATAALIIACSTVPVTGRSQFRLISNDDLIPATTQEYDRMMNAYQQKRAVLLPTDSPEARSIINRVNRVSERIIDAAGLRHRYDWQTTVVKVKEENAMVLPNGKIIVFLGIIRATKTEAGLAAVIGHEVAHVVAQHLAERVSQGMAAQFALDVVNLELTNSRYRSLISLGIGLGLQYGMLLPFSREHESEADHLGLLFMAKAGYDPKEAIGYWERDSERHAGPWEFVSTHPSSSTRVKQITSWLPEAQMVYANPDRPLPMGQEELQRLQKERLAQQAAAPIAPRPSFLPGYWWQTKVTTRSAPLTYRYVQQQPCSESPGKTISCIVVESETQRLLLTEDYATLDEKRKDDKRGGRYSPAIKMVDWPLELGKKWSQNIQAELDDGKDAKITTTAEVVAYESVTVPAGTFMAYKIVLSFNGTRTFEYWYAPEVRNIVRSAVRAVFGLTFTAEEMIDYQKTDEPVVQVDLIQ